MKNRLKTVVRVKHFMLLWLICILCFGVLLAIGTNFFTTDVQETSFGKSTYFYILLLGFVYIGSLSFGLAIGLAIIITLINLLKGSKTLKLIKSPIFIIFIFLCAITAVWYVTNLLNSKNEQIKSNQVAPSLVRQGQPKIFPDEVFELTNKERVQNGLKPLKRSVKLDEAALERAKVIIEFDEWSHEATNSGVPYTEAIKQSNYWNTVYGENLAEGQNTSSAVVKGWMNSPSHKENILDSTFQEIGVATYSGELNGRDTVVTVQLFGGYTQPGYKADYLSGWESTLNTLIKIRPSWENIKNYPSAYEANKQDTDRLLEIIDTRINRIQKIVTRIKANQWFTAEENRWTYEDENLYNEQDAISKRLNSEIFR